MGPLGRRRRYPLNPGWKDSTVSRDNAITNRVRFNNMQQLVLDLFRNGFVGTADEAADRLHISAFSARPRCSELVKMGELVKLRIDRSIPGRHAWVLGLAPPPVSATERPEGYYHTALEPPEEPPFDDGQPGEQQEWFDYDPDC